jgi:hypothetical protein
MEELVPSQLNPDKLDHDLEFEWLHCLASRLQTAQRLRPTEVGGLQSPEEFPALTTSRSLGENPMAHSIFDKEYRNHRARMVGGSVSLTETKSSEAVCQDQKDDHGDGSFANQIHAITPFS